MAMPNVQCWGFPPAPSRRWVRATPHRHEGIPGRDVWYKSRKNMDGTGWQPVNFSRLRYYHVLSLCLLVFTWFYMMILSLIFSWHYATLAPSTSGNKTFNIPLNSAGQVAVDPLQFVAITGSSIDIASTWGRPHPSPAAWAQQFPSSKNQMNPPPVLNFHTPNYRNLFKWFWMPHIQILHISKRWFIRVIWLSMANGERLEWVRQRHRLLCRVLEDLSRPNPWRRALVGKMWLPGERRHRSPKNGVQKTTTPQQFNVNHWVVSVRKPMDFFLKIESVSYTKISKPAKTGQKMAHP